MFNKDKRIIIQSSGYNKSKLALVCHNYKEEKSLSDFSFRNVENKKLEINFGIISVAKKIVLRYRCEKRLLCLLDLKI